MDEEEECLPENSSLNTYLHNLGYSDVQVTKTETANLVNKLKFSLEKSNFSVKVIDRYVIEQVEVITSTKLLFEEDFSIVEILLSNFKIMNNGMLKIMFQDFFGVVAILLGFCLYFVIGYYALVVISSFYAYKCADYLNRKSFVKIKLKRLVKLLKDNSSILKKSVDFIKMEKDRFLLSQLNSSELTFLEKEEVNFYFYSRFKSDFLSCVNEMINILVRSTEKLIKKIPLIDYADTPEYYLCSNFKVNCTYDDPSKLYLVYLLLQSEFLRRVILSLIPNIHLFPKNNNFNTLREILRETTVSLMRVRKTLQSKFYCGFKSKFELPKKVKEPVTPYMEEFISSIHNASNVFSNLFMKCGFIEECIDKLQTSDKLPQNIEVDLVTLQSAIQDCQDCLKNIEKSFILLKKINAASNGKEQEMVQKDDTACNDYLTNIEESLLEKGSAESGDLAKEGVNLLEEEIETSDDNLSKIKVGYTDFGCVIEDDIFEAYISNENENVDCNLNDWELDEVSKKNLKKEFSQNVMKELKGRLVEKAKNWRKREMDVLKKKGLLDSNSEKLLKDEVDEVEDENENENETEPIEKNKEIYYENVFLERPKISYDQQMVGNHIFKTGDEDTPLLDDQLETRHCFGNLCKAFLKDLSETRKLIFKTPIVEEEFCLGTANEEPFDDKSTE